MSTASIRSTQRENRSITLVPSSLALSSLAKKFHAGGERVSALDHGMSLSF